MDQDHGGFSSTLRSESGPYDDPKIEKSAADLHRHAKSLKRNGKIIAKKKKKTQSKELPKYKGKYQNNIDEIRRLAKEILELLGSDDGARSSRKRKANTWDERRSGEQPWLDLTDREYAERSQLEQERERLRKLIKDAENNLKQAIQENERQTQKLNDQIQQGRRQDDQMQQLKKQRDEEREGKEDALRRLSALASSRLRDNNPNITDLSDQNRPTKIAEKLSELYDNQWTDAFDVLQEDNNDERAIIRELLEMLMQVFNECGQLAQNRFFERIQDCIEFPTSPEKRPKQTVHVKLPDQMKQQAKEFRRERATLVLGEIEEVVLQNLRQPKPMSDEMKKYLSGCVEIGWLSAVQDPPLMLSLNKSHDRFDTNMFKDYTKRGPYVDFVVWPALLLHKNGPLLAKGVAQGCHEAAGSQGFDRQKYIQAPAANISSPSYPESSQPVKGPAEGYRPSEKVKNYQVPPGPLQPYPTNEVRVINPNQPFVNPPGNHPGRTPFKQPETYENSYYESIHGTRQAVRSPEDRYQDEQAWRQGPTQNRPERAYQPPPPSRDPSRQLGHTSLYHDPGGRGATSYREQPRQQYQAEDNQIYSDQLRQQLKVQASGQKRYEGTGGQTVAKETNFARTVAPGYMYPHKGTGGVPMQHFQTMYRQSANININTRQTDL